MVVKSVYRTPPAGRHTAEKGKVATVSLVQLMKVTKLNQLEAHSLLIHHSLG